MRIAIVLWCTLLSGVAAAESATLAVDESSFREPALDGDPRARPEVRADTRTRKHEWQTQLTFTGDAPLTAIEIRRRPTERPHALLLDLEAGHHYRLASDPCCTFPIHDADSTLTPERDATPHCADAADSCAADRIAVPSFIAADPRCAQHVCVPPALVQLQTQPELASAAQKLTLTVGDAPLAMATTTWQPWPWSRETSPVRVVLRRGKTIVWDRLVQLRLAHRYRIVVPADPTALTITRVD